MLASCVMFLCVNGGESRWLIVDRLLTTTERVPVFMFVMGIAFVVVGFIA